MIVLKATQDKVLAALQSVAGIVARRHALPILANVLIRKMGGISHHPSSMETDYSKTEQIDTHIPRITRSQKVTKVNIFRSVGFFSSVKTNLRNAP